MEVRYRLESVVETEFKINYDFDYSGIELDSIVMQLGHEINPIMDKNQVVVKVKASLVYGKKEVELATNTIAMRFGLSPINEIISLKDDGTFSTQNSQILDVFIVTAVGALRGIMMKNLKGTPLETCFLPLLPMEQMKTKKKSQE